MTMVLPIFVLMGQNAWGSLSVFTKGNPRTYVLTKSFSSPEVHKSELYFEGADLKRAYFLFSKDDDSEGILCEKTKLETSDGKFVCEGYYKKTAKKKQLKFKFDLEPIKDGFNLDAKIEKPSIKLKLTFKKK